MVLRRVLETLFKNILLQQLRKSPHEENGSIVCYIFPEQSLRETKKNLYSHSGHVLSVHFQIGHAGHFMVLAVVNIYGTVSVARANVDKQHQTNNCR